jgi:cell division protein FtsN
MAEASAFAAALERKGFKPFIVSATIQGKGTWYRVRMGRFSTEILAQQGKGMLTRADIPAWVLRAE